MHLETFRNIAALKLNLHFFYLISFDIELKLIKLNL